MGVSEYVEYDKCFCVIVDCIVVDVGIFVVSPFASSSSHDRSSDRPLRNDLRNLSTNRVWNLFKLPWLSAVGFGGLQPVLFFVGLVNELCDVRDDVRENGRELVRLIGTEWPRWAGDAAKSPGVVAKLGHSERHSDTLRDRHEPFEHSDTLRARFL
jgi:hypothetical protein